MTDNEIMNYWGEGNLVRWRGSAINWGNVPTEIRNFLSNVGLPICADWCFDLEFGPGGRFSSDSSSVTSDWIIEGTEDDDFMFLDDKNGWQVRSQQRVPNRNQFVNTTVRCLAEVLTEFRRCQMDMRSMRLIEDKVERISVAEATLRRIDERVFATDNSLWVEVLDDLRG